MWRPHTSRATISDSALRRFEMVCHIEEIAVDPPVGSGHALGSHRDKKEFAFGPPLQHQPANAQSRIVHVRFDDHYAPPFPFAAQASALRQLQAPTGGVCLPLPAHPAALRDPRPSPPSPTHSTSSVLWRIKPQTDASRSGKTTNLPATGNGAGALTTAPLGSTDPASDRGWERTPT